eukprot:COSAG02_NODE_794_length_17142_cov_13.622367_11_plen_84_part_00
MTQSFNTDKLRTNPVAEAPIGATSQLTERESYSFTMEMITRKDVPQYTLSQQSHGSTCSTCILVFEYVCTVITLELTTWALGV